MRTYITRIIYPLILIFSISGSYEADAQIKPNMTPINFGILLIEQPDMKQAKEIFKYYSLTEVCETDSTLTFRSKDSEYTYKTLHDSQFPEIFISTNMEMKELVKQLQLQNYKKHNQSKNDTTIIFEKGASYLPQSTICTISKNNPTILKIFKKQKI